jgi:hypothetical protein
MFYLYGDVTIAGEGLQNLGLCSALRVFQQGGILIVPHLQWRGTSVFPISSEGPLNSLASYDTHGDAEDLFYPGSTSEKFHLSTQYQTNRTRGTQIYYITCQGHKSMQKRYIG